MMTALEKKRTKQQLKKIIPVMNNEVMQSETISLEILYKCKVIIAKIIQIHGSHYLSIFIRIEKEIAEMEKQEQALQRALLSFENR